MSNSITLAYGLGDIVYLATDIEQKPRMIVSVQLCIDGGIQYELRSGVEDSYHFEQEVTPDRNMNMVLNIGDN